MTTKLDYGFLNSLDTSSLLSLLRLHPKTESLIQPILKSLPINERDKDAQRKRDDRAESARIFVPPCKNPARREACLADPERFLRTYFPARYRLSFGKDHLAIIQSVIDTATNGGRDATAAPRGRGKSEIVKGLLCYVVAAGLTRFPLAVAATTALARRLFKDFKKKWELNDLLYEDFPEICHPIRALEGAPQRAGRQHIDGVLTQIVWSDEYVSFPKVEGSKYGGVKMTYYGLDAAFRGANIDGDRPDFVLIDDPETRESAKSLYQINDRELILDQDIAGLASQEDHLAIVVLTTVQNSYCLSAKLTDRTKRPAWNGKRFGMVVKWPDHTDLWDKYIELRKDAQQKGDPHGLPAIDFYLPNRERMDEGVEMITTHFKELEVDGRQLVVSAIQQAYNQISDTTREAYETEYQNNPTEQAGPEGIGLTADLVAFRLSGLARGQVPIQTEKITVGIDIGKRYCHWVAVAWWRGAGGVVCDYGVMEVKGNDNVRLQDKAADIAASEPAIYRSLVDFRDELLAKQYTDAEGTIRKINFVLVDSGTYTNAVYEFTRQVGGIFHPSKGIPHYRQRKESTQTLRAGNNQHAQWLAEQKLWLYEIDPDYWKQWVHERFLTPTFDESNMLRRGSLSLFEPVGSQNHFTFGKHIASEELLTEFKEGKGVKTYWNKISANNHYLDAIAYAAACTESVGVELLTPSEIKINPIAVDGSQPKQKPVPQQRAHGNRFKQRSGGWVRSLKRR